MFAAVAAAVLATSCAPQYGGGYCDSKGGVYYPPQQVCPPSSPFNLSLSGTIVQQGGYQQGGGYCPSQQRAYCPPPQQQRAYRPPSQQYRPAPPQQYRPQPPRPQCPPGYMPRPGGGYVPRPTYSQGYASRGYPESGTNYNRNGQGYTPVNGYALPHPSGYLPPPFPFQTGGYRATSAAPQQMRRAPQQQQRQRR